MSRRNLRSNQDDAMSSPRGSFAVCPLLVVMIALGVAACRAGVDADPRLPNPAAERTIVAPVFEHGRGPSSRDEDLRDNRFVFTPESKALPLIASVFERYGATTFVRDQSFPEVQVRSVSRHQFPNRKRREPFGFLTPYFWESASRSTGEPEKETSSAIGDFSVDLYDPVHRIGIEYVNGPDVLDVVVYEYMSKNVAHEDAHRGFLITRDVAMLLSAEAKKLSTPRFVGVLYDPLLEWPTEISENEISSEAIVTYGPELRPETRGSRIRESILYRREVEAKADALRLVEMQVIDIAEWLKAQGAFEP